MASSGQEFIDGFAISIASRSPKTIRAHLGNVDRFVDWLATQPGGHPFAPSHITETAISSYLNYLKKRDVHQVHVAKL
ncbi:MAG: phage integrase N-terminal SAM-like domain-containing protein [Anaerolineales bacterium]|nr:phage integrase N-terminal SAM-like domain-containing protein [Anaerolineales bacterium]